MKNPVSKYFLQLLIGYIFVVFSLPQSISLFNETKAANETISADQQNSPAGKEFVFEVSELENGAEEEAGDIDELTFAYCGTYTEIFTPDHLPYSYILSEKSQPVTASVVSRQILHCVFLI